MSDTPDTLSVAAVIKMIANAMKLETPIPIGVSSSIRLMASGPFPAPVLGPGVPERRVCPQRSGRPARTVG